MGSKSVVCSAMKFGCPLIAVTNLDASKKFYQEVLNQEIAGDLGWNVWFSGGFAIQLNFADIIGIDKTTIKSKSHNFELYFEEDDFDGFLEKLKQSQTLSMFIPRKSMRGNKEL